MKNPLSALILCLLFTGCNSSDDALPVPKQRQIIATTDNRDEIKEIFDASTVVCAEESCPDSVAKLTFYDRVDGEYEFGVCSGTLIAPGLVLTNSHCIPDSIAYPGADCSGQIEVKYPGPKKFRVDAEMVKCQRVRSVYNQSLGEPDLALIEVDFSRIDRLKSAISANEPAIEDHVHAFTMNPSQNSPVGFIRKKTCKLLEENNLFENEFTGMGQVFTLGDQTSGSCRIISGNSGSGLFNDQNQVVGAVYAKVDEEPLKELLKNTGFIVKSFFSFNTIGLAVNIKCLGSTETHNDPECPISRDDNFQEFTDFIHALRVRAGLEDTPNDELVVTIDKDLRFGVKEKPSNELLFSFDHIFISYDDFLASESSEKKLSNPLTELYSTLKF